MSLTRDITGQKFGKLTAIKFSRVRQPQKRHLWFFKCDCGIEKEMLKSNVVTGKFLTCGCSKKSFREVRLRNGTSGKPIKHSEGYILIHHKGETPYVHRQVMAEELKKYSEKMQVHHINGKKYDNRKENLMVVTPKDHMRLEKGWKCINNKWFKVCSKCKLLLEVNKINFYFRRTGKGINICKKCCSLMFQEKRKHDLQNSVTT